MWSTILELGLPLAGIILTVVVAYYGKKYLPASLYKRLAASLKGKIKFKK